MRPHVTVITLGVDDLERSVAFYRDGLGFPTKGIVGGEFEHGAVAFFELQGGLMLAVWPRDSIAHHTGLLGSTASPTEFTLGHNVGSRDEVNAIMEEARVAGATILSEAAEAFWGGYSGCFQDPDGHIWEVVWNPNLQGL